jgi:hypothetical protein
VNAAEKRALAAVVSGEIPVERDGDGLPEHFYPEGWLERVVDAHT